MTIATTFTQIPVNKITASPYQYRKTFGGAEDEDLAESVRKHGVLQPVRVRPNGKPGTFELVFGERRWRAAKAAELAEVPAIVVELGDDEVIEQLLVENLKRRDVHPLEEGEGYQRLLDKYGYTIDQLVSKTGKSKAHLYGRMKLTKLVPIAKKALLAGELNAMVAELIARVDPKLQEAATKDVLGKGKYGDLQAENGEPIVSYEIEYVADKSGAVEEKPQPLSFRAARHLIRAKYHLRLELAKFDIQDATLTKAGACGPCPNRTGNQPELPGMSEAKADDLCTSPECFTAKTKAAFERAAQDAKSAGRDVITGKEAEKLFDYDGKTATGSAYIGPDEELPYDLRRQPGKAETWSKLLGKRISEVPRVLAQDPNGAPVELLEKTAAVKILREIGKVDKPTKPASKTKPMTEDEKAAERKRIAKEREKEFVTELALTNVLTAIASGSVDIAEKKELALWKWIARGVIDGGGFGADGEDLMLHRRGLKNADDLEELIGKAKTVGEVRSIVVEYLFTGVTAAKLDGHYCGKGTKERFDDACRIFGVDWAKQMTAAKEKADTALRPDPLCKARRHGKCQGHTVDGYHHHEKADGHITEWNDIADVSPGGVGSSVRSWNKHAVEKAKKGASKK